MLRILISMKIRHLDKERGRVVAVFRHQKGYPSRRCSATRPQGLTWRGFAG